MTTGHLDISVEPLAAHPELLPLLRDWFESEWPDYYGPNGPGDAQRDLRTFANRGSLPVGVVAFHAGTVCGVAALKADSIPTPQFLAPWAAAGLVKPALRGQGIGAALLTALEQEARLLGYDRIYCGTNTSESLLRRSGWQLLEQVTHDGENLGVYYKTL